jgi:hypothetical protein
MTQRLQLKLDIGCQTHGFKLVGQLIVLRNRKQRLHGWKSRDLVNHGIHSVGILRLLGRAIVLRLSKGTFTIDLRTNLIVSLTTTTLSRQLLSSPSLLENQILDLKSHQVLDSCPRALSRRHRQTKRHLVANEFLSLHTSFRSIS